MTLGTLITELMAPMTLVTSLDNAVQISTHCLYPSNSTVNVTVRKHFDSYVVSDDGKAIKEVEGCGLKIDTKIDKRLKHVVKQQGLFVKDGAIFSPQVPSEALPAVILLVANASKEAADWMLSSLKFEKQRNFKKDVADLLSRYFNDSLKSDDVVIGDSNKVHHFAHVIHLSDKRRLLVDAVTNDSTSISARVIANLDVKHLNDNNIIQRIIFDDYVEWPSSDLKLLEMGGAVPIPFSHAASAIKSFAA
ncbi:MAG: hypothetical protein K2Q01_12470 [Rickettsiales bacterium]|nr:hypothetical protein [Rickettsiales bacterium]